MPTTYSAPTIDNEAALTTASKEVVAANASRQLLIITNTSTVNVFLAFGTDAVADKGILLFPNQSIEVNLTRESMAFEGWKTLAVNAIASAGAGNTLTIFDASFSG